MSRLFGSLASACRRRKPTTLSNFQVLNAFHSDKSSGKNSTVWLDTFDVPKFPTLTQDVRTEVCVIGAGIAGLSVAYSLCRAGVKVLVLDDGEIASGETGRTTAHLMTYYDDNYQDMEQMHGVKATRILAESHSRAIDYIEDIIRQEGIVCDFTRLNGFLLNDPKSEDPDFLHKEMAAARNAGLEDVHLVDKVPVPGFESGTALCFPRQGQFHITKYMSGLANAITRRGGSIFTHTHAAKVEGGPNATVQTSAGFTVKSNAIVVATNSPINAGLVMHAKQMQWRTYVVGFLYPKGAFEPCLVWDNLDPYHYVRMTKLNHNATHDVLIVGGEDHETGRAHDMDQRYSSLENWTRERFPFVEEVSFRWSGQVCEPVDGLAFIGRNRQDHPNMFVVTGDSGMGMTHATIAGMIIPELIQNREHPWASLYDPSRAPVHNKTEFLKEGVKLSAQYGKYFTPAEVSDESEVPPGEGRIMRHGLSKWALYRDKDGNLSKMSAVCPHAMGVLMWNSDEKTWDCSAHGSRFDPLGNVINGPANTNMKHVE